MACGPAGTSIRRQGDASPTLPCIARNSAAVCRAPTGGRHRQGIGVHRLSWRSRECSCRLAVAEARDPRTGRTRMAICALSCTDRPTPGRSSKLCRGNEKAVPPRSGPRSPALFVDGPWRAGRFWDGRPGTASGYPCRGCAAGGDDPKPCIALLNIKPKQRQNLFHTPVDILLELLGGGLDGIAAVLNRLRLGDGLGQTGLAVRLGKGRHRPAGSSKTGDGPSAPAEARSSETRVWVDC